MCRLCLLHYLYLWEIISYNFIISKIVFFFHFEIAQFYQSVYQFLIKSQKNVICGEKADIIFNSGVIFKGALCYFGEKTQNLNIYNNNELTVQTQKYWFPPHNWINNNVPKSLFEAKQSKTIWNVFSFEVTWFIRLLSNGNKEMFVYLLLFRYENSTT